MTIQVELDPETQARLAAEADRRGLDPAQVVSEILRTWRPAPSSTPAKLTVQEFHKMLEELHEGLEPLPHLPDSALTREGIYGDHA
jgi:hypothetical protein